MDPQLKQLLQENLEFSKENNRMLRAMRRGAWFNFVWQIIFWGVLVIGPLYLLAPYFGLLPSAADLQNLVNQYKTK